MSFLTLTGIDKTYPGALEKSLSTIHLEVEKGELFVIMGGSGSGKSTLIRLINKLILPDCGEIKIDGQDVGRLSGQGVCHLRAHVVSMVFQNFALFPHLNVFENMAFGLKLKKLPKKEIADKVYHALEKINLSKWAKSSIEELSGGMKQRVGLARALVMDTPLILLDEPFSAVDPITRNSLQDYLLEIQREHKKTMIFVTHDVTEAMKLADRMMVLHKGVIQQIGTPGEIKAAPANDYVKTFMN